MSLRRQALPLAAVLAALIVASILAGCMGSGVATHGGTRGVSNLALQPSSTPSLPDRSSALVQVDPTATPVPTAPVPSQVQVWWPDDFYPLAGSSAEAILMNQLETFRITYTSYSVNVRKKRMYGTGGVLSTLRTAAPVAPNALPDLVLMRRSDMLTAASEGLILPIDDWVPADIAGDNLFPAARALGEIDGRLYGVPYALTLFHTVYRISVFPEPPLTFDAVLAGRTPFLLPGGASPVSWTVLLQYIAAGGTLVDADGSPTLSPDALMPVLEYYAAGTARGIFGPRLLDYADIPDYWNSFVTAQANIASVNTLIYLTHQASVATAGLAAVPTLDGTPVTLLDGWMWVLTTQNPDHQQRALAFLSWMMRISQQSNFTEAYGILPSQVRALRLWDNGTYAEFAMNLLAARTIFSEERRNNTAASALQDAVAEVLRGTSPEMAADRALARVGR